MKSEVNQNKPEKMAEQKSEKNRTKSEHDKTKPEIKSENKNQNKNKKNSSKLVFVVNFTVITAVTFHLFSLFIFTRTQEETHSRYL